MQEDGKTEKMVSVSKGKKGVCNEEKLHESRDKLMKKHAEIQEATKKACEKRWSLENISDSKAEEKKITSCQKDMITRRFLYDRRSEIIHTIPHFWLTAFLGHHALGLLLSEEDQKIFEFLKSVNVEDTEDDESGYTITFNFAENQYFENESLTKKLLYSNRGVGTCGCTIKWKDGSESLDGEGEKQGYINGDTRETLLMKRSSPSIKTVICCYHIATRNDGVFSNTSIV